MARISNAPTTTGRAEQTNETCSSYGSRVGESGRSEPGKCASGRSGWEGKLRLGASAGYRSGAPAPRVSAEKALRPYQIAETLTHAVDSDTMAAIYRTIWRAFEIGGFKHLEATPRSDVTYRSVPVTWSAPDEIQATVLLAEDESHMLVRFYEEGDSHRIGTGIAGPFALTLGDGPLVLDAATLTRLYKVMNAAAAAGAMNNLNGQLMQDIGYAPIDVSVPLGEEPVGATALVSTGFDHFFIRFYEENDPHRIGTGLAGPFLLDR